MFAISKAADLNWLVQGQLYWAFHSSKGSLQERQTADVLLNKCLYLVTLIHFTSKLGKSQPAYKVPKNNQTVREERSI